MKIKTLLIWVTTIVIFIGFIFGYFFYAKVSPWKAVGQNLFIPSRTTEPKFLFTLGNDAKDKAALTMGPLAVDASDTGMIYVANTQKNQINLYDPNGKLVKVFGSQGTAPGEMTYPAGIKVTGEQVLVSEALNGRVQVFDLEGNFKRVLISEDAIKGIGGIKPVGMGVTKDRIYICDALHHRIVVTNLKGEILKTFGHAGSDRGEFSYPYDIAIDNQGKVYVSDTNNSRIQVFDGEGNYLNAINGQEQTLPFALPRGISFDQFNRLMVVDAFLHQVLVFEPDGTFLFSLGKRGTGDGELNFPNGIGVGGGRIFITDRENHRVLVYEP